MGGVGATHEPISQDRTLALDRLEVLFPRAPRLYISVVRFLVGRMIKQEEAFRAEYFAWK